MKDITADVKTMYHGVSRKDDYFEIMSKVCFIAPIFNHMFNAFL